MTDMGLNSVFEAKGGEKDRLERVETERAEGGVSVLDELGFKRIGYCFCGSFCTLSRSLEILRRLSSGERSKKFTNVPWIRIMYTPEGAYFSGSASTARRVSGVVTFTYR